MTKLYLFNNKDVFLAAKFLDKELEGQQITISLKYKENGRIKNAWKFSCISSPLFSEFVSPDTYEVYELQDSIGDLDLGIESFEVHTAFEALATLLMQEISQQGLEEAALQAWRVEIIDPLFEEAARIKALLEDDED